jgi:hypothetical protein
MTSIVNIRGAKREGARLVIMLAANTGEGKTRSALELAYGLADFDLSKVGFLDTENRRGSLYADVFSDPKRADRSDTPFLIGDLYAPFSPDRYAEAIQEFQRAGVRVLIIDSGSHEWEGIGGCEEIAYAGDPNLPNWNKAKGAHKRFMNTLLTCDMHVILCLRAREKSKPEKQVINGRTKTVYVDMGLQPITEKNVMFEATASLMLHDRGMRQTVVKCPEALERILGRGEGYLTPKDGKALLEWVNGAQQLDPKVEAYRNRLLSVTEKGAAYIANAWGQVPEEIRAQLGEAFHKSLTAAAEEFDKQRREATSGEGDVQDLNDALATIQGSAATPAQAEVAPAAETAPAPQESAPKAAPTPAPSEEPENLY